MAFFQYHSLSEMPKDSISRYFRYLLVPLMVKLLHFQGPFDVVSLFPAPEPLEKRNKTTKDARAPWSFF